MLDAQYKMTLCQLSLGWGSRKSIMLSFFLCINLYGLLWLNGISTQLCLYIYIWYIYDLYVYFVDNILKQTWAFFLHAVTWFPVLLYKSQFNISHLFAHVACSIWSIEWTWEHGKEEVFHIPKSPRLEPHYQIVYYHIQDTRWDLTPLHGCSRYILQPQPIGFDLYENILLTFKPKISNKSSIFICIQKVIYLL